MKKIKRKIALFLIMSMVLGYLPQNLAFANSQPYVNNLEISILPNNAIAFKWAKPTVIQGENDQSPRNTNGTHTSLFYELYMRNASLPQAYPSDNYLVRIGPTAEDAFTVNLPSTTTLLNNVIYAFKLDVYHYHEIINGRDEANNPIYTQVKAPMTSGSPAEIAYMNGIDVTAIGSGNELEVTWSNPKFDRLQVFTHYLISYRPGGDAAIFLGGTQDPHKIVSMNDPELEILPDGQLRYTLTDNELELGQYYAVRVEPMINGKYIRDLNNISAQKSTITANNKNYTLVTNYNEYRYNYAYIRPTLTVTPENEMLKLSWARLSGTTSNGKLYSVKVLQSINEDFSTSDTVIGEYFDLHAINVNNMTIAMPKTPVYFKLVITYKDNDGNIKVPLLESAPVHFKPYEIDFNAYKPQIFSAVSNPEGSLNYEITWEAFMREPYNEDEKIDIIKDIGLYEDKDINYLVLLTDSLQNFDDPVLSNYEKSIDADTLNASNYKYKYEVDDPDGSEQLTRAYTRTFSTYMERNDNGGYTEKTLEENKVYYIRIVAARKNEANRKSNPAYFSWYVYPSGAIPTNPVMISKPPLSVKDVSETNFTIQWQKKWFEVYDDATKTWHQYIGVDNGKIVYGEDAKTLSQKIDLTAWPLDSEVFRLQEAIADMTGQGSSANYPVRLMDLTGANYAIHVVQFDSLFEKEQGGYDNYYKNSLLPFDPKSPVWQNITPTGNSDYLEFVVTQENFPKRGNLSANMSYVLYFQPYIQVNNSILIHYPSYLTVTTDTVRPPLDPDPTVPLLIGHDKTATTATVKWRYEGLQFELKYSELLSNYSTGGESVVIDPTTATKGENWWKDYEIDSNGEEIYYVYYKVPNLFPETKYYFWICSISQKSTGTVKSEYSNPIEITTNAMAAPLPPQGLGLISIGHLETYNKENDTSLMKSDYNYIIAEWLRNHEDTSQKASITGNGLVEGIHSASFNITYAVKFNELIGNKMYYIRAKTNSFIYMQGINLVEEYTYTVQLADNEEFLDYVELEVPAAITDQNTNKFLKKESDWCDYIIIYTKPTEGEYDGDKNPNMYPLPTEDFEITYTSSTDTLTYRFRSNQTDSQGNADNLVDQRFISQLIALKVYNFSINVSKYNNKTVSNRVIILPYTIIEAFDQRKISLSIIADNLTITLPPGWLASSGVTLGAGSSVTIGISEGASKITAATGGGYVSAPQQLSVSVKTASRTVALERAAKDMDVALKLNNRYMTYDKNIAGYVYTQQSGAWQRQNSAYDNLSGLVKFQTAQIGSYSAIGLNAPYTVTDDSSNNSMYNVTTKIAITDLTVYNPNMILSSAQFNNILSAVSEGVKSFALNGSLPSSSSSALSKSGMLTSGNVVTREQGIASLVKLYENKTKTTVKNYDSITQTPYADIQNADSQYREALLKAGTLGFFTGRSANPKGSITLGDALYIVDLIMQDTGM